MAQVTLIPDPNDPYPNPYPYPTLINPGDNAICPVVQYNSSDPVAKKANREQYGLVKRMVYCVQRLVVPAAYKIMYQFSVNYLYGPIAAAMVLAVIFWGYLMIVGKNSAPVRDAFTVALKIGSVSFFTYAFGQSSIWPNGLYPVLIAIVDELAGIVASYVGYSNTTGCMARLGATAVTDVWGNVDCAINLLLGGIFDAKTLLAGLAGFFVASFVSGMFGLFIALMGVGLILFLVFTILRATYITITAYIALGLMAIVSPIFITMLLFKVTADRFEKWLKLTVGFMLQPLFLFAFLAMMLAAYDTVIYDGPYSVYRAILPANVIGTYPAPLPAYPTDPTENPYGDFQIGTWLVDTEVYGKVSGAAMGVVTNPRERQHIEDRHIGILGSTGESLVAAEDFNRKDASGLAINVIDKFKSINIYKVDIPFRKIKWDNLALAHECPAADPACDADSMRTQIENNALAGTCPSAAASCLTAYGDAVHAAINNVRINYLIGLFLALMLALLTMYIFYLMLDLLPFIGAGISGEKNSMPKFGTGGLSMPGNEIIDKLKSQMGKVAAGGK